MKGNNFNKIVKNYDQLQNIKGVVFVFDDGEEV